MQKFHVRNDGRTSYECMTEHRVNHIVVGFCENVQFKISTDMQDHYKYDGEWDEGYFVGVASRSSEYLVVKGDHILKCPTIRRKVYEEARTIKCMEDIKASFFDFVKKGGKGYEDGHLPGGDGDERRNAQSHGKTSNAPKCENQRRISRNIRALGRVPRVRMAPRQGGTTSWPHTSMSRQDREGGGWDRDWTRKNEHREDSKRQVREIHERRQG